MRVVNPIVEGPYPRGIRGDPGLFAFGDFIGGSLYPKDAVVSHLNCVWRAQRETMEEPAFDVTGEVSSVDWDLWIDARGATASSAIQLARDAIAITQPGDPAPDPATKALWIDSDGTISKSIGTAWLDTGVYPADYLQSVYDSNGDGVVDAAEQVGAYTAAALGVIDAAVAALKAKVVVYANVTTDKALTAADEGILQRVDASGGAKTLTLPDTTGLVDGASFWVRKSDSSANTVTVNDHSAVAQFQLFRQYDFARIAWVAGVWTVYEYKIAPLQIVYTSSGTVTTPLLAKRARGMVVSGGAGGGSGRVSAAGVIAGGGNGGNPGNVMPFSITTDLLGASFSIAVGAGGAGGAAVSTNDTDGNSGGNGGASRLGSSTDAWRVGANSTIGGLGGKNGSNAQTAHNAKGFSGSTGASASATGGAGTASAVGMIHSGASGGGITTGNVASAGGAGRNLSDSAIVAGGTAGGGAGDPGASVPQTFFNGIETGGGGGSGAGDGSTNGGAAGAPTGYGAPGSGGGGARNGKSSGAGSNGNQGAIYIEWIF